MQNITECKTFFVRINMACLKPQRKALQGRTACENKGHVKTCVNRGHDRLARGKALRGGFELRYGFIRVN